MRQAGEAREALAACERALLDDPRDEEALRHKARGAPDPPPSLSFTLHLSVSLSISVPPSYLYPSLPPSFPLTRDVTSERIPRRQADALVQLERADEALPPLRAQARAPRGAPPRCSTFFSTFVHFQLKDRHPCRRTRSHFRTHKDTEKLFFSHTRTHTCSLTHTRRAGAGGHSAAAARGRGDGGAAAGRRRWRFAARAGRKRGRCVRRMGRGPHGAAGARRQPLQPGRCAHLRRGARRRRGGAARGAACRGRRASRGRVQPCAAPVGARAAHGCCDALDGRARVLAPPNHPLRTVVTTPSAPLHGRPGPESRASGAASRPAPAPKSAARCAPRRLTPCGVRAVGGPRSRTSEGGLGIPAPPVRAARRAPLRALTPRHAAVGVQAAGGADAGARCHGPRVLRPGGACSPRSVPARPSLPMTLLQVGAAECCDRCAGGSSVRCRALRLARGGLNARAPQAMRLLLRTRACARARTPSLPRRPRQLRRTTRPPPSWRHPAARGLRCSD